MKSRWLLAALAAAAIAAPALAQPAGTLKKITDSRSIALGFRLDAPPFSYRGSNGEPTGYSTYHALQVDFNRRFAQGFDFGGAYTWSKALSSRTMAIWSAVG